MGPMKAFNLFLILNLAFVAINLGTKEKTDILFIVHDAGESYMLQPVIDRLLKEKKPLDILTIGEPASTIFESYDTSRTLEDYGVNVTIEDGYDRTQLLRPHDVESLISAIQPLVVATGMVYWMQSQLCAAYTRTYSSVCVGVDDAFTLWDEESVPAKAFVEPGVVDEVFVTANSIAEAIADEVTVTTTGSPTLNAWREAARDSGAISAIRHNLYREDPVGVVYAGGYGNASYTASLKEFCDTAAQLGGSARGGGGFAFAFSPHPGYSPSYEAGLFDSWGCSDVVHIIPLETLDIAHVVAASNVSLSQCSTVGGQSISIGVPHAYLSLTCEDVFTNAELIPRATSASALSSLLTDTFATEAYAVPPGDVVKAGIPLDATRRMAARLEVLMGKGTP